MQNYVGGKGENVKSWNVKKQIEKKKSFQILPCLFSNIPVPCSFLRRNKGLDNYHQSKSFT